MHQMEKRLNDPDSRTYFWGVKLRYRMNRLREHWQDLKKNPWALAGGVIVALFFLAALAAPVLAPYGPDQSLLQHRLAPPAFVQPGQSPFLLGGDEVGRDILSRILYGARISLLVGVVSVSISAFIGVVLGMLAGYFRGWFDALVSRFADLLLAFPFLIFAIGIMAITGPGFRNLIFALTFKGWVEFFRVVRSEVMVEKTKEYVDVATINGRSHLFIIFREIFPNIRNTVLVLATLRIGYMVIMEASLSYMGLGVQGMPAWGSMIKAGKDYMMTAWWVSTLPGIFLLVFVLGVNLFGEGLRDALDPRLKVHS